MIKLHRIEILTTFSMGCMPSETNCSVREIYVSPSAIKMAEKARSYMELINQVKPYFNVSTMNGTCTTIFINGINFYVMESLDYILSKVN